MILNEIFNEFINVVQENDKYIIGLIDNEGNIMSCSKKIDKDHRIEILNPRKCDFFYKISIKNKDFGYLWVSSEDDSLKMVGNLLGESLNTRIMYEMNEDSLKLHVTKDDELVKCLLDEENFDMNHILRLINELQIDGNKTRVAIYICNNNGFDVDEILRLKVNSESKELVYSLLDNTRLLLFKDVPNNLSSMEVKTYLNKYIRGLQNWGLYDCFYIVGSLQTKLKLYSVSYKNCLWIKKNISLTKDDPVFFMDYLFDYFISQVQLDEVHYVFDYYRDQSKDINMDELILIANKLYANDYNITQTAKDLFLHKNSLIYKIKKYEDVFNIDIRGSFQGKLLFYLISNFFRDEKKRKQVGVKS